jgi:hypothetical protein
MLPRKTFIFSVIYRQKFVRKQKFTENMPKFHVLQIFSQKCPVWLKSFSLIHTVVQVIFAKILFT